MKLLLDENLSRKLIPLIEDLFPGSLHVSAVLAHERTSDKAVWDYARKNGFAIVTADNDFLAYAELAGTPKIIVLANCDYPTREAARLIVDNAIRISELSRSDQALLVLRR